MRRALLCTVLAFLCCIANVGFELSAQNIECPSLEGLAQSDNYILIRQGSAQYYDVYYSDGSKQVEKRGSTSENRYSTADGTLEAELVRDHKGMERVWVKFRPAKGVRKTRQDLNFMAPGGARLQSGSYTGGFRLAYLGGGHLSVSQTSLSGSFEILHIAYGADGQLSAFDAKFREKRGDYALYGEVRYRR